MWTPWSHWSFHKVELMPFVRCVKGACFGVNVTRASSCVMSSSLLEHWSVPCCMSINMLVPPFFPCFAELPVTPPTLRLSLLCGIVCRDPLEQSKVKTHEWQCHGMTVLRPVSRVRHICVHVFVGSALTILDSFCCADG